MTTLKDRLLAIELILEAIASGARCFKACNLLDISIRTFRRWRSDLAKGDQRNGPNTPANKLNPKEREDIITTVNSSEFIDKTPQDIVPLLADQGKYIASVSSFYRVMRDEKLLSHRGTTRAPKQRNINQLMALSPNEIWSWDITYLNSDIKGKYFYLYLIMDIYSRKIIGYHVYPEESSSNASMLIKKSYAEEGIAEGQVTLHSDNGSPMKGYTMLATLEKLGVAPSFSRPSVSNDNAYSESLFRTLKHNPRTPSKPFKSVLDASEWVDKFVLWYNYEHLHSGIKFVTPISRHTGRDVKILEKRKEVFKQARMANPQRWTGDIRNWDKNNIVYLNKRVKNNKSKDRENYYYKEIS